MDIGDEWIYRRKTYSPSQRVKILGIEKRKQTTRIDIELLDGERIGLHDNVARSRLHGLWSTVVECDERMANWQRLSGSDIDDSEESAFGDVFDILIPESIARYDNSSVRNGATVRDRAALEQLMRRRMDDLLDCVEWFDHDDVMELSADGTLMIAQYVCAGNPSPLLERVLSEEAQSRVCCKGGREYDAIDGSGKTM